MSKILVVFTGGTIGSSRENGAISPDGKNASLLLDLHEKTYGAAEFESAAPYTVLSENLSAEHLKALRRCVADNLNKDYSGIIVTHGTDTLQYTAAYLDLTLGLRTPVPVVLVSANYPLADSRSNGLSNFAAAVGFIKTSGERGVFVSYHNTADDRATFHRGADVLPHLPLDDSVYSLFSEPFGIVQNGVFIKNPAYSERERADRSACELNGRVLYLRAHPGMVFPEITLGIKAVLLEGYHSGTLPTASEEFAAFCRAAQEKNVPLYLTGSMAGFEYESKQAFEALGIRVLPPMSPVEAYVRVWLM